MRRGILPSGWADAYLADVAWCIRERVSPREFPDLPFIGMDAVEPHSMRLLKTVPAATMKSSSVHFLPGDVLYGRLRVYLNKVVAPNFEGLASAEFIPLSVPQGVSARFLQYRLNSSDFVSFSTHQDEGDRPRVSYAQIGEFRLGLPPTREQCRIAVTLDAYLSRLDAAEATLDRARANLSRYRASVLQAAVEGRLVPTEADLAQRENRNYEPASELLKRIHQERRRRWEEDEREKLKANGKVTREGRWKSKYKEPAQPDMATLPELPTGWCWATLDQLARSIRNGYSKPPRATSGLKILRISSVRPLRVDLTDVRYLSPFSQDVKNFYVGEDDLLFTRYNGNPALVGVCGKVTGLSEPILHPDKVIRVVLLPGLLDPGFVELACAAGVSRQYLASRVRTTAGQAGISGGDLKTMPIPLAPLQEQGRIAMEVAIRESVSAQVTSALREESVRSARLRQSILKWAFEGKLVDQDPNDEPASVLLDRIRAEREARGRGRAARPLRRSGESAGSAPRVAPGGREGARI